MGSLMPLSSKCRQSSGVREGSSSRAYSKSSLDGTIITLLDKSFLQGGGGASPAWKQLRDGGGVMKTD